MQVVPGLGQSKWFLARRSFTDSIRANSLRRILHWTEARSAFWPGSGVSCTPHTRAGDPPASEVVSSRLSGFGTDRTTELSAERQDWCTSAWTEELAGMRPGRDMLTCDYSCLLLYRRTG